MNLSLAMVTRRRKKERKIGGLTSYFKIRKQKLLKRDNIGANIHFRRSAMVGGRGIRRKDW